MRGVPFSRLRRFPFSCLKTSGQPLKRARQSAFTGSRTDAHSYFFSSQPSRRIVTFDPSKRFDGLPQDCKLASWMMARIGVSQDGKEWPNSVIQAELDRSLPNSPPVSFLIRQFHFLRVDAFKGVDIKDDLTDLVCLLGFSPVWTLDELSSNLDDYPIDEPLLICNSQRLDAHMSCCFKKGEDPLNAIWKVYDPHDSWVHHVVPSVYKGPIHVFECTSVRLRHSIEYALRIRVRAGVSWPVAFVQEGV